MPDEMTLNEYQRDALRTEGTFTRDAHGRQIEIAVWALGIAGEAGEVADHIKKVLGHGHPLTQEKREKIRMELGDVLWYIQALADALGFTLEDVAEANLKKLQDRYPQGFSHEASQKLHSICGKCGTQYPRGEYERHKASCASES